MGDRPRGGALAAPNAGGQAALPTPRLPRGSVPPPHLPGGGARPKASKRRRPHSRARRHARRQQQADDAAAAAAPFSTLLASVGAWNALGAAYWVIRTIRYGFKVPWERTPPPTRSFGYAMKDEELEWCRTEGDRWVLAGYVTRLSKAAGAGAPWVSPTFVVYGGKPRLVVDLRRINENIRTRLFKYMRLDSFLTRLAPDDHLVSWDVRDAFYHVRLWPAHRKYFRFVVCGAIYEPRVLPFGMKLSPWVWTKVMRPVVAALRLRGFRVNAYVDDFAATGRHAAPSTKADATEGRTEIMQLFDCLGAQVHPSKGVAEGTQQLPLLGFLMDTRRRLVLLPAERLANVVHGARVMLKEVRRCSRRVTSKALQCFSGLDVSCSLAIPLARSFLRRLYDCQRPTQRHSRVTPGAMADLHWFAGLDREPGVGRALWPVTLGTLTTDASLYGCGGHWQHLLPAAGFFTAAQRNLHINVKEVAAVRFCLLAFGAQLLGQEGLLNLRVDSRVALHVINGFSSRSPALMEELRKLHAVAQHYRVTLRACWLPSVANVWADVLSRQSDREDWRLSATAFDGLQQRYGCHTVDRFASPLNTHCPRFNPRLYAPGTKAVDAFTVPWAGENNWVNPPFSQVERVINKVVDERATATVIVPVWVAQPWWAPAVAAAQEGYLLPVTAGLLNSGRSQRPAKHPRWRFAVLRFVNGGLDRAAQHKRRAAAISRSLRARTHNSRRRALAGVARSTGHWRGPNPAEALMPLPPARSATSRWSTAPPPDTTLPGASFPPTVAPLRPAPCRPLPSPSCPLLAPCGAAARRYPSP